MTKRRKVLLRGVLPLAVVASIAAILTANGCSKTYPNQNPVGMTFPTVTGKSLEKDPVTMPEAFAGEPAVVLVGYLQRAQFDIDRWLLGLIQAEVKARLIELPTIPGLVPSFASKWIDDGMRSGIPREDWGSVITLYGDSARPVAELTGNEGGQVARVLVLDRDGTIIWFDDEGYSPRKALAVARLVETLDGIAPSAGTDP